MRSEFVFLPLYILFGAVRANGERTIQGVRAAGPKSFAKMTVDDASGHGLGADVPGNRVASLGRIGARSARSTMMLPAILSMTRP